MTRSFTVAICKDESWYVAKCLENSVASQGESIEEALDNLREALELYYEDAPIPILPKMLITTLEIAI